MSHGPPCRARPPDTLCAAGRGGDSHASGTGGLPGIGTPPRLASGTRGSHGRPSGCSAERRHSPAESGSRGKRETDKDLQCPRPRPASAVRPRLAEPGRPGPAAVPPEGRVRMRAEPGERPWLDPRSRGRTLGARSRYPAPETLRAVRRERPPESPRAQPVSVLREAQPAAPRRHLRAGSL